MKSLIISLIAVSSLALISCAYENDILDGSFTGQLDESLSPMEYLHEVPQSIDLEENCGVIIEKALVSKNAFVGGTLYISNDAEELHLVFVAAEGWMISETHLYFGELELIPSTNKGKANISLGQFPYKKHYDPPLVEVPIISIARQDLPLDSEGNLIIVAHATVVSGEEEDQISKSVYAEWVDWLWFSGPQWGGGFIYKWQICDGESQSVDLKTNAESEIIDPLLAEGMCIEPSSLNLTPDNQEYLGTVGFSFDEAYENLVVTYALPEESEYLISVVHVNFGELETTQMSKGKGRGGKTNPVVGKFDYVYHLVEGVDDQLNFPYNIALEGLNPDFVNGECENVIVHATLITEVEINGILTTVTKSAYAEWEIPFTSPKKGGYFELCILDCLDS